MDRYVAIMMAAFAAIDSLAAGVDGGQGEIVRLGNGALCAEIAPAWAGRLMRFSRAGGANAFWTNPAAADATVDANGKPVWKNVGGEKTWVGSQGFGWRAFAGQESGSVWPPPAWFDSTPFEVVRADATSALLRSSIGRALGWAVAVEREFTLGADRLTVTQRLVPAEPLQDPAALPDDWRRLWSVAQIPRPDRVAMRLVDEGRRVDGGEIPEPSRDKAPGWVWLDISGMRSWGKTCVDGDALAAPLPDGSGWLLISQAANERHLAAFETPGRAMVYASPVDFEPSPYVELEFAAYGPDAAQTLTFRILDSVEEALSNN